MISVSAAEVRYSVCLIASTAGSAAACSMNSSTEVSNESYGCWTRTSPPRIAAKMSGRRIGRGPAGGGRSRRSTAAALRSGRSSLSSDQRSARSRRPSTRTTSRGAIRSSRASRSGASAESRDVDLEPRHELRAAAAREHGLHRLDHAVAAVELDLVVRVARDPERGALEDLHPGEERGEPARDQLLERDEARSRPEAAGSAGRFGGTFTRAMRRVSSPGARTTTARFSDRFEMNGKGWAGSTASGVSTGKTCSAKTLVEVGAVARVHVIRVRRCGSPARASAGRPPPRRARSGAATSPRTRVADRGETLVEPLLLAGVEARRAPRRGASRRGPGRTRRGSG